jgi:hypothetical protein
MNAILRLLACAAVLTVASWGTVLAQDNAPATGRALVLDNERVLEGQVSRQGDLFRLHREDGSELTLPATKVLAVCADLADAYRFVASRTNLRDADERLRLARWCFLHNLRDEAQSEVNAALQLRPNFVEARQFLTALQHASTTTAAPPPNLQPAPPVETRPVLDVSGECLAVFTTRVQPILMNTCAGCHASGRGGAFVLTRGSDAAARKATQQNLTAAIKQICFEQPDASPLLCKAACAHGGSAVGPLPNHEAVPFVTLRGWIEAVAAQHPHLRSHGAKAAGAAVPGPEEGTVTTKAGPPPTARNLPPGEAGVVTGTPPAVPRAVDVNPGVVVGQGTAPTAPGDVSTGPAEPRALPTVQAPPVEAADEFDAVLFNRQWHPKE